MTSASRTGTTRRSVLAAGLAAPVALGLPRPAAAGAPAILTPLPPRRFVDFGTNAEMRVDRCDARGGWTQWSVRWRHPRRGSSELLARAADAAGRTQPLETPYNDNGYFFDAVVRHPVTIV